MVTIVETIRVEIESKTRKAILGCLNKESKFDIDEAILQQIK